MELLVVMEQFLNVVLLCGRRVWKIWHLADQFLEVRDVRVDTLQLGRALFELKCFGRGGWVF